VLITDDDQKIETEIKGQITVFSQRCPKIGQKIKELGFACLNHRRERVRCQPAAVQGLSGIGELLSAPSLAALALAKDDLVNAVVSSQEMLDAAELVEGSRLGQGKLYGLADYMVEQGDAADDVCTDLTGMRRCDAREKVFAPVLRWAKNVKVIDKFIMQSFENMLEYRINIIELEKSGRAETRQDRDIRNRAANWNNFKMTLGWIYRCWSERCAVEKAEFEIVTEPGRLREREECKTVAVKLWEELGSNRYMRIRIAMRKKLPHARFLVTMPKEFTLHVDRGFDFITEDEGDVINTRGGPVVLYSDRPRQVIDALEAHTTNDVLYSGSPQ
jgi:hypothetical protein